MNATDFPHAIRIKDDRPRFDRPGYVPRETLPEEAHLVRLLQATMDACDDVLDVHGDGCADAGCLWCRDVACTQWFLETCLNLLGGQIVVPNDEEGCPLCGAPEAGGDDDPAPEPYPPAAVANPLYAEGRQS